jgi:ribosome-binding factor A
MISKQSIECADQRRVARVQQQMRREISQMFQQDQKVKGMLNPDYKFGIDVVSTSIATVSDCEVSNDLQVVKVYVSVLGDDRAKKNAMKGLKKISLRLTPEVRFVIDESFERGQKVSTILDALREERVGGTRGNAKASAEEMLAIESVIAERGEDEDEWLDEDDDDVFEEDLKEVVIKPIVKRSSSTATKSKGNKNEK